MPLSCRQHISASSCNPANHLILLQFCLFLLTCTFAYILFLLIYLNHVFPSFRQMSPSEQSCHLTTVYLHCYWNSWLSFIQNKWRDQFSWLRVTTGKKSLGGTGLPPFDSLALPMILSFPSSGFIGTSSLGWSKDRTEIKQMEKWHFTVKVIYGIMGP